MPEHFGEQFLHQRDPRLHTSPPVEHETERLKERGESVSQKPSEKISEWMKVLERTHTGHRDDPRVLERIKSYYHKEYVINPDDIPESYYENQQRIARERGHGDIEITPEIRRQSEETIISDQESTLDNWVDYFTSPDSDGYPTWSKYWAFKGVVDISTYDKEKHAFGKRGKDTVAPFPDINREALAYVIDAIVKKANKENIQATNDNPEFKKLLEGANFGKLYAWAIEKVTPAEESELSNTSGEWIKYNQGSDHMPLVESIQGHGTGWCTAGETTARTQLDGGDFYVYYTYDKDNKPTIPRVAIRMQEGRIAEIRGVAADQNLDPEIARSNIISDKLKEFGDKGERYQKRDTDMRRLTDIERGSQKGEELSVEDLKFLYEINERIEGFGYERDPRIEEIRKTRNPEEDAPVVLECKPEEIAWQESEVIKDTKAYIGALFKGIFTEYSNIEHIYTSFPEGEVRRWSLEIGGKTADQLEKEMREKNINIQKHAEVVLHSQNFTTLPNPESIRLFSLTIEDLGLEIGATTLQVYRRAKELGLELCPAEVGPHQRLKDTDQKLGNYVIAMEQISVRYNDPFVLYLSQNHYGLWLNIHPFRGSIWFNERFVFSLRPPEAGKQVSQET